MKTKFDILAETVEEYSNPANRAIFGYICQYITKNGKMCAVGRCCKNPSPSWRLGVGHLYTDIENILKDEYRGHSLEFWKDVQHLHDEGNFYNKIGYTERGVLCISELFRKWTAVESH